MTLGILMGNRLRVSGKTADDLTVGTWFQGDDGFIYCIALDTITSKRRVVRCGGKADYLYISNVSLKEFQVDSILKPETIFKVKINRSASTI